MPLGAILIWTSRRLEARGMTRAALAEKGADVDVLRQMVQFMVQRLMELDVEGRCGAGYDEKNTERINSRNGYRVRPVTRAPAASSLRSPSCAVGHTSRSSWSPGARQKRH
jgi:transposase-like protein